MTTDPPGIASTGDVTTKGERTRQSIVAHGIETAHRIGLGGLTIGELATATGLSKSGLYAHFRSKEALQIAVLDAAADQFTDAVLRPALRAPRGEQRIRELFERWLTCGMRSEPGGALFVKAATELDEQPGPVRDSLAAHHRALILTIETIVRAGAADGAFGADADARQFATDLYGVMLAFYHAHRLLREPAAASRARSAFATLLAALTAGADPRGAPAPTPPLDAEQNTGTRR